MTIVRVDVAKSVCKIEDAAEEYRLLGGRGLIARILLAEARADGDALGRHSKFLVATGLLSGDTASSVNRISVGGKSPLTGTIKESSAGGVNAFKLGRLGIKAIIVEGEPRPGQTSVLVIRKDGVELAPGPQLRGLGVYEAAAALRRQYGEKAGLMLVGPAGEMLLGAAGVANTDPEGRPGRYCGRGGMGALMGAKGLKAIVIDDSGAVPPKPARPEAYRKARKNLHRLLLETPQTAVSYPRYGTAAMIDLTNALGCLPTRNFTRGSFEAAERLNGLSIHALISSRGGAGETTHACMPGCIIRCSNVYPDEAGREMVSPLEYETIGLLGANLCIGDPDAVARLNYLCNDAGLDTIETGAALGVFMEAGVLEFGDADAAARLIGEVKGGTMAGRVLGCGAAVAGKALGVGRVPAVKGQGLPAYEPRALKGIGVTYLTSPQGPDHTAGNPIRMAIDHQKPEGQVEASRQAQVNSAIYDTLGICLFVSTAVKKELDYLAGLVSAYHGVDWDAEDLLCLGESTLRDELEFNARAGVPETANRFPEHFYFEENATTGTVFDVPPEEIREIWRGVSR